MPDLPTEAAPAPIGPFCPLEADAAGSSASVALPHGSDPLEALHAILQLPQFGRQKIAVRKPIPPLTADGKARDSHVRTCLRDFLARRFPTERIAEEMVLYSSSADARIDLAVIGEEFHGYEIKSEADTLSRLSHQCAVYGNVLDRLTLVVAKRHVKELWEIPVPAWWGVIEVSRNANGEDLRLRVVRRGRRNPQTDSRALLRLLRQSELRRLLTDQHLAYSERETTRVLRERLSEHVCPDTLRTSGLSFLRNRSTSHGTLSARLVS